MKQTARIISTYAADSSGVCSALYELGGMCVIHDASGCNSTYHTHDEPRWYDQDSLVFISALSEMEAIMGDDEKLVRDITETALELHPRFVALCGTPIPMMIGTDLPAIASEVEHRTGIPAFGLPTNGMHSYLSGAGMAFAAVAGRFADRSLRREPGRSVNLLGLTPLDFSVNGSDGSMRSILEGNGFTVISSWAMGSTLDELSQAGRASVNLVVSYSGLTAARTLQKLFGTPYVVGVPFGVKFSGRLIAALERAADTGCCGAAYLRRPREARPALTLIGESVSAGSLAAAIGEEFGRSARVLCPLETEPGLLAEGDMEAKDEDDLIALLKPSDHILADPLYRPICPGGSEFYPLPSEAFSGRIFRRNIPDLIGSPLNGKGSINL
ncbi:MAG: nitrogenase component 1 [Intestinimonas sp.]|jgi:nitrogenase molybdenum-iron protein alpha/beta subunit|nr:nitrogenase component 1 [Intestinimonas sp.]